MIQVELLKHMLLRGRVDDLIDLMEVDLSPNLVPFYR